MRPRELGFPLGAERLEKHMTTKFDVVVIGTGQAALALTSRCRSAGWQVAVVDSRPFGGTCAPRGCDPKKCSWALWTPLIGFAE
jgi:cation diffusion facilitator CzcD-associated flavoprotein CzcO